MKSPPNASPKKQIPGSIISSQFMTGRLTAFTVICIVMFQAYRCFGAFDLQCEYQVDPKGVDVAQPRLGWKLESDTERGIRQSAYQVLVASSQAKLSSNDGDLWDSGKVNSDKQLFIRYAGRSLQSGQACWWKVRTWNNLNAGPSDWSKPASWTMGLLTHLKNGREAGLRLHAGIRCPNTGGVGLKPTR